MLCTSLIYSDPVPYILTEQIFQLIPYCDTLIIQMDLAVAEIHSVNYQAETQNRG